MSYVTAIVFQLDDNHPVESLEALVQSLPESALFFTNPLVLSDEEEPQFDVDVHCFDGDQTRHTLRPMLEIEQMCWVYSHAAIAAELGLTEEQVRKVLEDSR